MGSDTYNEPFYKAAAEWKPGKGGLPLAVALGAALLYHHMGKSVGNDMQAASGRAELKRLAESDRNFGDRANLMGGGQLSFPGAMTYQAARAENSQANDSGFDKDAAVLAVEAGRALAKQAGIGPGGIGGAIMGAASKLNQVPNMLMKGVQAVAKPIISRAPSMGLGAKVLAGGTLLGGGLLAAKAGKKAMEFGMQPAPERRLGAPGPGLPRYVNEYGQPEM